jgi:hypothetical protein
LILTKSNKRACNGFCPLHAFLFVLQQRGKIKLGGKRMDTKLPYKILGLSNVYCSSNGDGKHGVRYDTIFKVNNSDMNFLHDVTEIGIQVFNFWANRMHVLLPVNWVHIRVEKNTELILDDKGRPRIRINKKENTFLLRRFDFVINHLGYEQTGTEKKHIMIVQILDAGHVISQHPLDNEVIQDVLENDANGSEETLLEYAKEAVGIYLGSEFPDWQNPLSYWD